MNKTLLFLLILAGFSATAQVKRYQFKVSGNYPSIPATESVHELTMLPHTGFVAAAHTATVKESFETKAGLDIGGTIDIAFSKKFFFTTGVNASWLRYTRHVTIAKLSSPYDTESTLPPGVQVGAPFGSITWRDAANPAEPPPTGLVAGKRNGETTALYLQVPVMAGTSLLHDKLLIRAGATVSLLVQSTEYKMRYSYTNGIESYQERNGGSHSKVLGAATANVSYAITKNFGIDIAASRYLTPIYNASNRPGGKAEYTVLSAGLSYIITR
jgi:hypothetical protein